MRLTTDKVRVRVPATSANLGPGYDSFGLALALYDEVEVHATIDPKIEVKVIGEGAGTVPTDAAHLVARTVLETFDEVGVPRTGLELTCVNAIPHGRGLGSSAAAVAAGVLAVKGMISDPGALAPATVLAMVARREGHPDNAAPAVLGGLTLAWAPGPNAVRMAIHPDLVAVVAIPPTRLDTRTARSVLPASVPHADAAFQASRAALLVEALGRRPDLLLDATDDRLHQEQRRGVMPDSLALVDALRRKGVAAVVSGAGPTVLVLGTGDSARLLTEVRDVFGPVMAGWQIREMQIDTTGGLVEQL
jgi:homoserine kinase